MEKLIKALHQIEEEDPTLIVEQSATLKQTIIHGQGQLHLDLIRYRIEKNFGVHMDFERPKIPYRETITESANEVYRHKKQSGGAGQFGEVHMRIEPYYEGMPNPKDSQCKTYRSRRTRMGRQTGFLLVCRRWNHRLKILQCHQKRHHAKNGGRAIDRF
jgi:translation elongation factor EF-G